MAVAFDLDPNVHGFSRVAYDDLDHDAFAARPLRVRTLRSLRYMFDVERHTICYLRDMLVTPTHKDASATAFLTRWAYEDFWHSEAVASLLRAHGIAIDNELVSRMRASLGWRDDLSPVYRSVVGNILGEDMTTVHMLWGAVNEWCAQLAYDRIGELDAHPVLATLLDRIRTQRVAHVSFYERQARERLAGSARARKLARFALAHVWGPLGSSIHPRHESALVMGYLLGASDVAPRVESVDRRVAALPGLAGLHVVGDGLGRYGVGPYAGGRPTLVERLRVAPSARRWRRAGL
ncbi:MAG: hypothetical protein J2P24_19625 [Streptosporangiales bacterium]|nr:hypothetical protein [Streptosporangiales bacterium]MBO0891111.1 hypothetical protein [Acidothermales bacterium]